MGLERRNCSAQRAKGTEQSRTIEGGIRRPRHLRLKGLDIVVLGPSVQFAWKYVVKEEETVPERRFARRSPSVKVVVFQCP